MSLSKNLIILLCIMLIFFHSYVEFQKLAVTAGSPLNHFSVPWDAAKIGWAQSINNNESLKLATEGKTKHLTGKNPLLTKGKLLFEKSCTFVIESCTN